MTDQQMVDKVQEWFNTATYISDEIGISEKDNRRFSVVKRMITSYRRYITNQVYKKDFECSLRNYLLSFGTDITIPNFMPDEPNDFGLIYDTDNKKIFVGYDMPEYVNNNFASLVFKGIQVEKSDNKYVCPVQPFINELTNHKFRSFKSSEQQLAVIGALRVPDGYSALIAMFTGGGKSLITYSVSYQKNESLTLIIVPTISLMLDQYRNAQNIISPQNPEEIMYYHSKCDADKLTYAIMQKKIRMLFISPETIIKNPKIKKTILYANSTGYLKNLIIDEAHIVIEWGSAFRKDFQCLDAFQKQLLKSNKSLRTYLLSATFSKRTADDLKNFYSDNIHWIEIRLDSLRKEPRFNIIKCGSFKDKCKKITELVCKLPHPMILYVNTPDDAKQLQSILKSYGFHNTRRFTGKTTSSQREKIIKEWIEDEFEIMIATCAFGVGVDKKDVRTVLHTYIPSGPDQYYQECGRGGRDGQPCLNIMLYNADDIKAAQSLMQKVLTTEKLVGRWFSMINSDKANKQIDEVIIDTSVKPDYREDINFFADANSADITWNVYTILLLRRAGLLKIESVDFIKRKYIFSVSITDHSIMYDNENARQIFEKIREDEYERINEEITAITSMLKKNDKVCWSAMFNEEYLLTDEYCGGCNCHDQPVSEGTGSFPLKKKINYPILSTAEKINLVMNGMKEMLVFCNSHFGETVSRFAAAGVDMIVIPDDIEVNIDSMKSENTGLMITGYKEFFELSRKENKFYLSGSIVFVVGNDSKLASRLLRITETKEYNRIFIVSEDIYISGRNKKISELINGPFVQDYYIEKELI